MVTVYAILIINEKKTFAQVPDKLKPAVKEALASMDLDENGNPLH